MNHPAVITHAQFASLKTKARTGNQMPPTTTAYRVRATDHTLQSIMSGAYEDKPPSPSAQWHVFTKFLR